MSPPGKPRASSYRYNEKPVYTTSNGAPVENASAWQRVGPMGPLLLQDFHLIDQLAHFDRERIPERVVHAKGAGAYGEFEVTHDISDIATIDMLLGILRSHLQMDPARWIIVYTQIHLKTDQGNKTFTNEEAIKMSAENPDWSTQDLFDAIERREYPSWTVYVQTLTPNQAEKFKWNVFDLTKVWPQKDVPLRPFGKLTLNRNAENYFAEIEQAAFSPSHMVPGVEPSADPVLQARLFSYPDTHRHRLGVNYQQIPVNAPLRAFNPFQRDGAMAVNGNYGANPNYPSTSRPLSYKSVPKAHEVWSGEVVRDLFGEVTPEDYEQATGLWRVLGRTKGQQANFVHNVAIHLSGARQDVRRRTYEMFSRVSKELGQAIAAETEKNVHGSAEMASKL
ncbi:hypothetical protein ONZ43_g3403 [Nemania bipapillata]|uniref:Uncharacterized protein n=1 Tax=Nemania bipapillata TaxID=110536 RepID=A0ACC2IWW6_9PEZI|nr:hypothetical protein ONZ43_g3403 [Nemania bipapillata]